MLQRAPCEETSTLPPVAVRNVFRRLAVRAAVIFYGLALFLALDWGYSSLRRDDGKSPRRPDPDYHHGLVRNFAGYDTWGERRYRFYANSLGFRDETVREVPAAAATRRILVIGDSFTEGIGVTFEESFVGRLAFAGTRRDERVEFLNAGVVSYSPVLYYKKIKYFIEHGLRFDAVVVLPDVSDVYDEATKYFCQDDEPQYRKFCTAHETWFYGALCRQEDSGGRNRNGAPCLEGDNLAALPFDLGPYLARHFAVTDAARTLVKFRVQEWLGNRKQSQLILTPVSDWLSANSSEFDSLYAPLGIEGGIARSLGNMQKLADLLKAKNIPLTVVVYPWPVQLALGDRDSRQIAIWREFCKASCNAFIDLFPAFFAEVEVHQDWYERLFISGDFHLSGRGHQFMFEALAPHLL
jgi:lysophospholipase L1-like esterase